MRCAQWLGRQRWFALAGRGVVPIDRALQRATKGRLALTRGFGLAPALLTTTGRRSGQPRSVPLIYFKHGDGFVVTASNWGQQHHPAWSSNLLACPDATVMIGGRVIPVRARLVEGVERAELWSMVTRTWPAYDTYAARSGRDIRVFVLEPAR